MPDEPIDIDERFDDDNLEENAPAATPVDELAARRAEMSPVYVPPPLEEDPGNRPVVVGDIVGYFDPTYEGPIAGQNVRLAVVSKVTDHDTITLQCVTPDDLEYFELEGGIVARRPKKGHSFGTPFQKNIPRFIAGRGERPASPCWQVIE